MTLEARRLYLIQIRLRYKNSTKKEKGKILDEFCQVCGYSRNYAIRILRRKATIASKKRGRRATYGQEEAIHLYSLWKSMRCMCSVRMKAGLPLWLQYYNHPDLKKETRNNLLKMSSSTIDRLLRPYKKAWRKGKSATKPGALIKSMIPIELLNAKITQPGYLEADTVAHCGNSLAGAFAWSLTMTDLFSGWTENRAIWTKNAKGIVQKIREIRGKIPFHMRGFACDNGSEFLNYEVTKYFRDHTEGRVHFTRRRPYKKNDAAHVEQKNDSHVRQLFGYSRLDSRDLIPLMNDIYSNYWNPLNNFFYPVLKLKKKIRIGSRVKKIYDAPKTPYERLLEHGKLTDLQKENLKLTMSSIDPIKMKNTLDDKLRLFQSRLTKDQIMGGIITLDGTT